MKILIIEDEALIQKSLTKLLQTKGHDVDATPSGKQAIKMILSTKYDRIICDLMLQDISGFDIIEESKKIFSQEEVSQKFIIITAYSSPQVLINAKKYNCRILNKPFEDMQEAIALFSS